MIDGPTLGAREAAGARDCVALLTAVVHLDLTAAARVLSDTDHLVDLLGALTGLLMSEVAMLDDEQQTALQERTRGIAARVTERLAKEGHR